MKFKLSSQTKSSIPFSLSMIALCIQFLWINADIYILFCIWSVYLLAILLGTIWLFSKGEKVQRGLLIAGIFVSSILLIWFALHPLWIHILKNLPQ
jgi:hypothetical protein